MVSTTFSKNLSTKIGSFLKPDKPTFIKKPYLPQHVSQKQNQSKLQLHAKYEVNYKQPEYESFKQYR